MAHPTRRKVLIGGAALFAVPATGTSDFTTPLNALPLPQNQREVLMSTIATKDGTTMPTLVMQGGDDQVVPYKDAALLQAKLLKHGTLKIYPGFPHGMMTTNADVINADLLAFIRS